MITILAEDCNLCGLCADLCHEYCITLTASGPVIDQTTCSTCTQCIAACPTRALAWNGTSPVPFERQQLPSAGQLDELFKERRSIRRFQQRKIERAVLAEIVRSGSYAPTHAFHLRVIIVDDELLISTLDRAIVENCRWIQRLAYRLRLAEVLAGWLGFGPEMQRARPKIEAVLKQGHAFHSMPRAIIFIVGPKNVPLSDVSAQYAMANMMYTAQVKGVGACLWANGSLFIDKHCTARQKLGLHPGEHIFAAMVLGYPAVKFSNKDIGKIMPIQWNNGWEVPRLGP